MLVSLDRITGYKVSARDEEIGSVRDFYFDDHAWQVRYIVVDTGSWLAGRQVLISPVKAENADHHDKRLTIALTADEIRRSPGIEQDLPVSMQTAVDVNRHYVWAPDWQPIGATAIYEQMTPLRKRFRDRAGEGGFDPRLRSVQEVCGYGIQTADEARVGHIEDFLADAETWEIRYAEIDTRDWLPSKNVLISPHWVDHVDWADGLVLVVMTEQQLRNAPPYEKGKAVDRDYEERLHKHYGEPNYWSSEEGE